MYVRVVKTTQDMETKQGMGQQLQLNVATSQFTFLSRVQNIVHKHLMPSKTVSSRATLMQTSNQSDDEIPVVQTEHYSLYLVFEYLVPKGHPKGHRASKMGPKRIQKVGQ